jgi:sugar phosphate isomerase/epimerase
VKSARYTFGISEFTTWPWSFEEDVQRYAGLGVEAIEVCEFKLPEDGPISDQLKLIERQGLSISSMQPSVRTLFPSASQPEPKPISERIQRYRRSIERCGEAATGVPFVTNTGIPPNGNMQCVRDTAVEQYRDLAEFAASHGARIALEPLNAAIMNVESSIWTLGQGLEIVHAVDRDNFGICLDVWNIWQNAGILETIRGCGDRIFVVQLSDWRTPCSYQDRLIPGQGDIPLPDFLRAIRESGFDGPLVVEIFSGDVPDSLWKGDLADVIEESRAGLDRAWEHAFSPNGE